MTAEQSMGIPASQLSVISGAPQLARVIELNVADLVQRGQRALERGELHAALDLLSAAITRAPEQPEPYLVRAEVWAYLREPQRVEADLRTALACDPASAQACAQLGLHALEHDDAQQAVAMLCCATEHAPSDAELWVQLSIARGNAGDQRGAITALDRAVELGGPGVAQARYLRGVALADLDEPGAAAGALVDLAAALDAGEGDLDLYFYRGLALYRCHCYELAVADFDYVIALDPSYHEAYTYRARARRAAGLHARRAPRRSRGAR